MEHDGGASDIRAAETVATAVAFGRGAADRTHVTAMATGDALTLPPEPCGPARLVRVANDTTAVEP